jgi:hypothetical protein
MSFVPPNGNENCLLVVFTLRDSGIEVHLLGGDPGRLLLLAPLISDPKWHRTYCH